MERRSIKVTKERQVITYAEIWHASHVMLDRGERKAKGSYYELMASLIFTAFTLEAYLNHIGKQIFSCWDDLEQLSPQKKLNVIAEKLGVDKDDGKRPFQTIKELFKFRNDVAHGKSVVLKSEDLISATGAELDDYMYRLPETEWETYCSLENSKRAREDVKSIIERIHDASGVTEYIFGLGIGSGLATVIHGEKT
ncbi:MAG: hypothetical protein JW790_01525 [Dehalococcoidales bacterium]|nr:hypothetical protein [Dehalococcoidales bacterium]